MKWFVPVAKFKFRICRTLVTAVAGVIVLGGCGGGPIYRPIEVHDVTLMPEIRVSKNLTAGDRKGLSAEFGAFYARGSDSTSLTFGEARLGNVSFLATQNLTTKYRLTTYDASLAWKQDIGRFRYELSAGPAYADLHLALSSPTASGSESISSAALRIKAAGGWRILTNTHVDAGVTLYGTSSSLDSLNRLEISATQTLSRHFTLHGGYSSWQVDSPSSVRSRFDVGFSGPSVGLGLRF